MCWARAWAGYTVTRCDSHPMAPLTPRSSIVGGRRGRFYSQGERTSGRETSKVHCFDLSRTVETKGNEVAGGEVVKSSAMRDAPSSRAVVSARE